jgi:hypothetical protein
MNTHTHKQVIWLRIAFWWGIVADVVEGLLMLFPQLHLKAMQVALNPDPGFVYGMRYGAPLMFGFTAILIWADRKPVERKDILLLTACFPVVGYYLFRIYAIAAGMIPLGPTIPTFVMQTILMGLLINGYRIGNRLEQAN